MYHEIMSYDTPCATSDEFPVVILTGSEEVAAHVILVVL